MPALVNAGGNWKTLKKLSVRESGSWKKIFAGWVRESGVWKLFHADIPENLIVFHNGTAPGDWTLLSSLNNYYLRGSDQPNGDIGSNSHSDAAVGATSTGGPDGLGSLRHWDNMGWGTGPSLHDQHTHPIPGHTHGSADGQPPYYAAVPYTAKGALPAGTLLFFRGASAPTGFTVVSAANGRYVKCVSSGGGATGGADTHSHPSVNPGASNSSDIGYPNGSGYDGGFIYSQHSHSASHIAQGTVNPVHVDLMLISADSPVLTLPAGVVGFFIDSALPEGWGLCDGNGGRPNYMDALVKCAAASSDTKTGSDTHTDSSPSSSTGSTSSAFWNYMEQGTHNFDQEPHVHYFSHSHGSASSIPLSKRLMIAIKL